MSLKKVLAYSIGTVVILGGVGAGGAYYALDNQKQKIENGANDVVANLQKGLPKGVLIKLEQNNTLNESLGKITIKEKEDLLVLNYKVKTGLDSLLSNEYEINGDIDLNKEVKKYVDYNGSFMVFSGKSLENGDVNLAFKKDILTIKDSREDKEVGKANGLFVNIDYKKGLENLTVDLGLNKFADKEKTFAVNNIKFSRALNLNKPDLGKFNMDIREIESAMFNMKGVNLAASIEEKNAKYNIVAGLGFKSLDVMNEKDLALRVKYSFNNIDKGLFDLYKQVYKEALNGEKFDAEIYKTKEFQDKIKKQFMIALTKGFDMNLDELFVGNKTDSLKVSAKVALPEVKTIEDVSFERDLVLGFNLNVLGKYSQMAPMFMSHMLTPEEIEQSVTPEELKFEFSYKNAEMLINKIVASEDKVILLKEKLKELDNALQEEVKSLKEEVKALKEEKSV